MLDYFLAAAGFVIVQFYMAMRGHYFGPAAIKIRSQVASRSIASRAIRAALRAYLSRRLALRKLEDTFDYANRNQELSRPTPLALQMYDNDEGHGYAAVDYAFGGDSVETQQRGLSLPLIESYLAKQPDGALIVEIGTGNGDVIAHLANKYPDLRFLGLDFSVKNAVSKHSAVPNLSFRKGYPLDALAAMTEAPALAFASSTTVVLPGPELAEFIKTLADKRCKAIILNEPSWFGASKLDLHERKSIHLEQAVWFHDYEAYLKEAGYAVKEIERRPYKAPGSNRPDIVVTLLSAELG